ncbi:hypothetical protein [Rossellomorea marisflavi]|uniref:hypothetical protein n=1 Tax=Rossellomorea marisflavi TaxID=189381 RepID=UPI003F9F3A61
MAIISAIVGASLLGGAYSLYRVAKAGTKTDKGALIENMTPTQQKYNLWMDALKKLGENPDEDLIWREASYQGVPENYITYEAVMTRNEFRFILGLLEGVESDTAYDGYFDFNCLESAIQAKKLAKYMFNVMDMVKLLDEKNKIGDLSTKGQGQLKEMQETIVQKGDELKKFASLTQSKQQLSFSKVAFIDEDELLKQASETMQEWDDYLAKTPVVVESLTSPALTDLNTFLLENKLPDKVEAELKDTIKQIEEKLKDTQEDKEESDLVYNAKIAMETAKKHHEID